MLDVRWKQRFENFENLFLLLEKIITSKNNQIVSLKFNYGVDLVVFFRHRLFFTLLLTQE